METTFTKHLLQMKINCRPLMIFRSSPHHWLLEDSWLFLLFGVLCPNIGLIGFVLSYFVALLVESSSYLFGALSLSSSHTKSFLGGLLSSFFQDYEFIWWGMSSSFFRSFLGYVHHLWANFLAQAHYSWALNSYPNSLIVWAHFFRALRAWL